MWWELARLFSRLTLYWPGQATVEGLEHVPKDGPVIVAVNHVSWSDPVLAASSLDRGGRTAFFLAKHELFRTWFQRWILTGLHVIPMDRARGDMSALRQAADQLKAGGCLILFPEGTRSRTGLPGRPKPGVAFLASLADAPVVPARVVGTRGWYGVGKVAIKYGPPMRFEGEGGKERYQAFAQKVMDTIFSL